MNHRITGDEAHRDDIQRRLQRGKLRFGDPLAPEMAAYLLEHLVRIALKNDLPLIDDRHATAELADVLDDVRRENDDNVIADLREKIEKTMSFVRVESRGRLVDDDES